MSHSENDTPQPHPEKPQIKFKHMVVGDWTSGGYGNHVLYGLSEDGYIYLYGAAAGWTKLQ